MPKIYCSKIYYSSHSGYLSRAVLETNFVNVYRKLVTTIVVYKVETKKNHRKKSVSYWYHFCSTKYWDYIALVFKYVSLNISIKNMFSTLVLYH